MKTKLTILLIFNAFINISFGQQQYYDVTAGYRNGIRFWQSDMFKVHMGNDAEYHYGPVTDYSIKMNMNNIAGMGWTWGVYNQTPVAAINNVGQMQLAGSLTLGGTATMTSTNGLRLAPEHNSIEFVNSAFSAGYGARLYGNVDGSGLTSFRLAVRGNSSTWKDAMYVRAADNGAGGGNLGFIGFGTNSPATNVEIVGSSNVGFRVRHSSESSAFGISIRQWDNLSGELNCMGRDFTIKSGWDKNLTLGMPEMSTYGGKILIPGGNVGIGTTNPGSYRLAVEGKIGAREVNVTTAAWSDYVFDENYPLQSLGDVENFIKENKHLPSIPSEAEVLKNGQNLGEMNMLLLKKIEELTLYVIESKKEINELRFELKKINNSNND